MRDAAARGMKSARSMVALFALVSLVACHRRTFENRAAANDEVIVTSTTVITNAEIGAEVTENASPAPAPAAQPESPPATQADAPRPAPPLVETYVSGGPTAERSGSGRGTYSVLPPQQSPAQSTETMTRPEPAQSRAEPQQMIGTPIPAPSPVTEEKEPPRKRASAADRESWAGDSVVRD